LAFWLSCSHALSIFLSYLFKKRHFPLSVFSSLALLSPRHKKNKAVHASVAGNADEETVERRKKEKAKYYERTEIVLGKCLLHRETDAGRVDAEVRAFVGTTWGQFKHPLAQSFKHNQT
jgi:hypothetical protein